MPFSGKDSDSTQEWSSRCFQARFWAAVSGTTFVCGRIGMNEDAWDENKRFTQQSKKDRTSRGTDTPHPASLSPASRFFPSLLPHLREMSDREVPASWAGNDSDTNSDMWGFLHTKKFRETSWRSYKSMSSAWHWTWRQHQIPQVKGSVWLGCPSLPSISSLKFRSSPVILANLFRWKFPRTLH